MGKKHFCHVRFFSEESVDHAMCITGYRIKLDNKDDKEYTGRLHIDYAQAKDDMYEWECKQRAMAREQRHRNKLEEEKLRGSSPPPINRYSDHEAVLLLEKLKCDETFMEGVQVVVAWLERSECTRKTANQFYGFVQTIHAHVRRLINEKTTYDEELENVKFRFRQRLENILKQFEQIDRVFMAATQQKAWDHFSKAQRKNIDVWRKQAQDTKEQQEKEFLSNREELEMEMSDSEDEPCIKKKKTDETQALDCKQELESEIRNLKEENNCLKCRVEACKNEVYLLRQEAKKQNSGKKIEQLEHPLQGMQKEFLDAKDDGRKCYLDEKNVVSSSQNEIGLNETEAKLLCYISTFLHVHPFGASLDYIWSYLQKFDLAFRTSELEKLLERFPNIFNSQMHGIGANIEKRWRYVALDRNLNT
ncbi:DgyrCDS2290 [Dimorphilus gyrociliatus]|uniref:DgyrCDS2290 n=1 Tax=Dimorphilus gyrociliatus TaxID=2664684 RepID=A0A7I8V9U1_9ANNE|nr:DgyrCDS2290 [Dimorphilus gyrociliatus]